MSTNPSNIVARDPTLLDVECATVCHRHLDSQRIQGLMIALNAERLAGYPSGRGFSDAIEQALATVIKYGRLESPCQDCALLRRGLPPARLRRVFALIEAKLEYETISSRPCG